jgi:hypothetical protein
LGKTLTSLVKISFCGGYVPPAMRDSTALSILFDQRSPTSSRARRRVRRTNRTH